MLVSLELCNKCVAKAGTGEWIKVYFSFDENNRFVCEHLKKKK